MPTTSRRALLSKTFSADQVERIVRMRLSGASWVRIAAKLNREWLLEHTPGVYSGIGRRHTAAVVEKIRAKMEPHPHADFTREALGSIVKVNRRPKRRFFITAVGAAADVHKEGFAAVLNFCEKQKAALVLLPMPAHVRALESQPLHYDPILRPFRSRFATEYAFNENVKAFDLQINPQQIQPLTGVSRIRGRNLLSEDPAVQHLINNSRKTSILIAHSKQNMETIATGNDSPPRILHSTGAITIPNHLRNRIGIIAQEDHVLGGLILEINDDEFYITQVQINPRDGTFVDKYGRRYHPDGEVTQERAEAFVMGDIHPGLEDRVALGVWYDVWQAIKPKRIFLHDWFDAKSITHHLQKRGVSRALRPRHFRTLQAEIVYAHSVLYDIADRAPEDAEVVLVASNHPEHVDRYLEEGRYLNDCDDNYDLGHRMVVDALDGKNPLRERLDPDSRLVWLDRNTDYIVEGAQCGSHGDLGMNGAKGSIRNNETVHSSSMTAHSHAPGIFHGAYVVGHTSEDRHGYNPGPSGWVKCSGAIYRGGHKQLIVAIKSNWKID